MNVKSEKLKTKLRKNYGTDGTEVADFSYFSFWICHEIQLANTNAKSKLSVEYCISIG